MINSNYASTMVDEKDFINDLNKNKTNLLMAPPSFIRQLLPYIDRIKVKLKKIITYAEVLSDADKAQFERIALKQRLSKKYTNLRRTNRLSLLGHLHISTKTWFLLSFTTKITNSLRNQMWSVIK